MLLPIEYIITIKPSSSHGDEIFVAYHAVSGSHHNVTLFKYCPYEEKELWFFFFCYNI